MKILENWKIYYKRLAAQQVLAETLMDGEAVPEQEPGEGSSESYAEMLSDQEMMRAVFFDLQEGAEDSVSLVSMIRDDQWEQADPRRFHESLTTSTRGGFLTPYSVESFAGMKLFKLEGYNIGFAVKSDGDVVSVHNNSGVGGVGSELMQATIRNGGAKLDHFDGFLTGLYVKNGFSKVLGSDSWNDAYAPQDWKYEPVNIFDPRTSIHAKELATYDTIEQMPAAMKAKIKSYEAGKPDIVYRGRG